MRNRSHLRPWRDRILALHVEDAGTFRAAGVRIRELGAAMERGDYPGLVAQAIEATRQREARPAQDP